MNFPARKYLEHYYKDIGPENQKLIEFYSKVHLQTPEGAVHLEIGGGPTIYQHISLASKISRIIHTDISIGALNQIKYWIKNKPESFDWSHFIISSLIAEGVKNPTTLQVQERSEVIKKKFHKLIQKDLSKPESYIELSKKHGPFLSISANFSLEAITTEIKPFEELTKALYKILGKGGILNLVIVEECHSYQIGKNYLKTLHINRDQIIQLLVKLGFSKSDIDLECMDTENSEYGYKGIMFLTCKKR